MPHHFLFGPIASQFAELNQRHPPAGPHSLTFGYEGSGAEVLLSPGDGWEDICARLPEGWRPEAVLLYLPYTLVPAALWSAPVPLIGWAADAPLLFHAYRLLLPHCDLVVTDSPGVQVLGRAGIRAFSSQVTSAVIDSISFRE
jgi:hypothetical protein